MTKLKRVRALVLICLLLLLLLPSSSAMGQRRKRQAARQTPVARQTPAAATASLDFYPLRVGDSWTYRHSEGNQFTFKVLREEKQADGTIRYVMELSSGTLIDYYYSKRDGWVLLHRISYPEESTGLKVDYDPAKQFLKNPLTIGAKWSWSGKDIGANDVSEESQVIGQEWVEVPAGRFQATKLLSKVTQGGGVAEKTYWYVDGVGVVKCTTEAKSAAGLFSYNYVLIDYSFKKNPNAKPTPPAPPAPQSNP